MNWYFCCYVHHSSCAWNDIGVVTQCTLRGTWISKVSFRMACFPERWANAASMGLVSNASSTHSSVFFAKFQFWVIEVTKCSRKKLIEICCLGVCTVNVLIPKKTPWKRKSRWWCIKIKHRKFTKTQSKTHIIRIWMIQRTWNIKKTGKWNCESNTRWKIADNPIAIPHGRLWDGTVVGVVAVGGVVSVAVAVAELV